MNRNSSLAPFTIILSILCVLSSAIGAQPLTSRSATASLYVERGNAWAAIGEGERAIADYDLAIASGSNQARTLYNRGVAHYLRRDFDNALADFNRAIQIDPRFVQAWVDLFNFRDWHGRTPTSRRFRKWRKYSWPNNAKTVISP